MHDHTDHDVLDVDTSATSGCPLCGAPTSGRPCTNGYAGGISCADVLAAEAAGDDGFATAELPADTAHRDDAPRRHERIDTIPASPQLDALLDERDSILIGVRLDAELAAVRAAEPRADTKAGNLQSLCSGLLLAGLALLSAGRLPGPAVVAGWVAAMLLGVAVALLSAAVRPNLAGNFGFVRWARLGGDQELLDAVAGETSTDGGDCTARQARQLRWLSRSLYGKFARIRAAQSLLVTALAVAALAAALTATGR